jgi:hypothetical protein
MSNKPSVAVVGAGHAGLVLALGLQSKGHPVTLVTDRTPEQMAYGKISSTQFLFSSAQAIERKYGLNFWEDACPTTDELAFYVGDHDGNLAFDWSEPLDSPGASVDYRVKIPYWLNLFARRGGRVLTASVTLEDLDSIAESHDLTVVSTGKGDIGKAFAKDPARCTFDLPQRSLAITYLQGMKPRPEASAIEINVVHGVGEIFTFPVLTTTGPADLFLFEGIRGGELDCWDGVDAPDDYLATTKSIIDRFTPWLSDRVADTVLTDAQATLRGMYPPVVRKPVAFLPSGRPVLGMADVVVLNDPITGEGANNAVKCAGLYIDEIVANVDQPFDEEWMNKTFEKYWDYVGWVTKYTNILLGNPPHVGALVKAGLYSKDIRRWHADSRNNPIEFFPAWEDPDAAQALIDKHLPADAPRVLAK